MIEKTLSGVFKVVTEEAAANPAFGKRMEEVFRRDEKAAREISLEEWQDRSLWQRIKEFCARLMGYWL